MTAVPDPQTPFRLAPKGRKEHKGERIADSRIG
jgi:hypothetical protein